MAISFVLPQNNPENQDILWRLGFAYSMGHNLDISGSADKCNKCFEKLLALNPEHPRGNFFYGAFLAGTATRQKDSIVYLEKAAGMGFDDAIYMLGFVYLGLGNKEKALEYFQKYLNKHPDNKDVVAMIDAIKSGRGQMIKKY